MRNYPTRTYSFYDRKRKCYAVKATTTYAGKSISCYAYTNPEDVHNAELGGQIANLRLDAKIAHKRAKSMRIRAERYANLIAQYEDRIRVMKREVERAIIAAGNREVEAAEYEAELDTLLKSIG